MESPVNPVNAYVMKMRSYQSCLIFEKRQDIRYRPNSHRDHQSVIMIWVLLIPQPESDLGVVVTSQSLFDCSLRWVDLRESGVIGTVFAGVLIGELAMGTPPSA
ncbi:hypothetical protein BHE74_00018312 [Ensete ventricosum]|nr:hypothetical protein BHE74_00018312 [Ensete ventricosum]RZR98453.1 hypothetical protein BHM03_00027809 [Ensete ventricosum]